MPEKTKALAVDSAVITETGTSKTYGIYVKYRTDTGYDIMYAHLSEVNVKKRQKIKQGDVVGLTGNTGLSTGPHLHYSIWRDGELLDPMNFLKDIPYTKDVEIEYLARGETISR